MKAAERAKFCATCGAARKPLEPRREFWRADVRTPGVPRSDDPEQRPWQQHNDLIVSAQVYRNGGTSEDCHLCDACLRIGMRALKLEVDQVLEVIEDRCDKDAELAALTERLANLQLEHANLRRDFDNLRTQESKDEEERMKDENKNESPEKT
jgi:hypothetical protein